MSEKENLKKAAAPGSVVSGGIGGVATPALGGLGVVGDASSSGILHPEQSRRFIDYVWDQTVLAKDGRRVTLTANTAELDKVNVGQRVVRLAAQADGTYTNAPATFTKVSLSTTKMRLDWELSTEALEDNIAQDQLEDHLVRLMTNAFANDLEDLAINGDTADIGADADFLNIFDGFVKTGSPAGNQVTTPGAEDWTPEQIQLLISKMPRNFRAIRSGMKFYVGTDGFVKIVAANGTNDGQVWTEDFRNSYLGGSDQTWGSARATRVLGVPVLEVPLYPDKRIDLTFPQNRIWGFQRDVQMHREYKIKKDTIEYTVFVRFGIVWEETDAIAWMAQP